MDTVKHAYDIDEDTLNLRADEEEELGGRGDYWQRSRKFYDEVKEKDVNEMSEKQCDWLQQLEEKTND